MASFSALDPFKLSAIKLTTNELGTGSYASVYEVNYLGLKCAGKKIHEVLLKQSGEATYALTRFAEECRLLSRMRHPNIVQFLGVYFEKGMKVPLLIMEFLPTNLSSCIDHNGILRSEISYSILYDVSLGLNYLHSHSPPIIHRDLSSNNVLLAASMKAKISDLGVAKILNLTPLQVSRVVRNTETPGTGAYMPPEAMIANPSYNTSIDVFSYGVMMIHVFSGQWPEPQCGQIQVEGGKMIPKSEADRRQKFLDMIGKKHPLMDLILRCIDIDLKKRPSANEVVPHLNDMVAKNPPPFLTRLEMLQRIDAKSEELQHAKQEITKVEAQFKAFKDKQQAGCIEGETKTLCIVGIAPESVAMSVSHNKMYMYGTHYILMKDATGEKPASGVFMKMIGLSSNTKPQILRGELLRHMSMRDIPTQSSGLQPNFSLEGDPSTTLQAIDDDVAPLSKEDYFLLLAVKAPTDRFRVFSDPQLLGWGKKLNVGQQVHVRLPSPNPMDSNFCLAIVRYKGFVKTFLGTMFGVEIKDGRYRGKGTTNGVFQDGLYFTCDVNCGVFVSLDKLSYVTLPGDIQSEVQSQQSTNKPPSYVAAASHAQSQSQPSRSGKKGPSVIDPPRSRFKINDHVVVFDKHNTPLHGTVRWTGRKSRMGRDLGSLHVGIEMIMHINATDVPGAKTGLSDLFITKKNHSIVILESFIMAVEDYTDKQSSKEKKNIEREMGNPPPYTPSPIALAREYKMTEHEFLARQQKAYREMESQKKKQDEEKLSHEVKQAIDENLSPGLITHQQQMLAEYQNNNKLSETGNTRNVREQQPGTEVNRDISGRDIRKQHSWQPQSHVYGEIPATNKGDQHRKLACQGKSSSVAQGEGIGDTFGHEGHQHYGLGVGGVSGGDAQSQMLQQNREIRRYHLEKQAREHEPLTHHGSQHHGRMPLSEGGQHNKDKPGETGNSRNVREQLPICSTEVNPDISSRDIRKQHSWQPQSHVYDAIPAAKDVENQHRMLAAQGKSSSVAQGEGIGDTFGHEGHQHYGLGVGGVTIGDTQSQMLQQNREIRRYHLEKQACAHEKSTHHGSQHHGRMPLSEGGLSPGFIANQQRILAEYQNKDKPRETGNTRNVQEQLPTCSTEVNPDISSRDIRKQHSWQPQSHVYDEIPATKDVENQHRMLAAQGKSSSVAQGEGIGNHGHQHYGLGVGGVTDHSGATHFPRAQQNLAAITAHPGSHAPMPVDPNLSINSRIQLSTSSPTEPYKYGVIKWLGKIPAVQGLVAGIEMDDYMDGCTDGTLASTGQKFFNCLPGRGIYYPLVNLQPDIRFADPATVVGGENLENPLDDAPLTVAEDQFTEGRHDQMQRYIGDRRGIQGHQNSCYLDASIFGLFALTDAFDEMFLHAKSSNTAGQNRQAIAELLWKGIVNPLRKNGVVRYESVMALRTKLDELGKMEGIAHAEKDPEEFLNMLFKYTLKVDPFLTIRHPYGDEPEFFVQLFVEYNESMKLPTVGLLLHTMFIEQKLSFLQMPSRLLVQVPRFRRQFKTYEKIIPDLKLDVSDLTEEYRQAAAQAPRCFICDEIAESVCRACGEEFNKEGYFCAVCEKQYHSHPKRRGHTRNRNIGCGAAESTLDLLSVICIETSHYVCFTKEPSDDPSKPPRWIFFDSMANRVYDRFNIPSVSECSDLLNEWVYPANGDLSKLRNTAPRELPEFVRRFTQDLYLCVYINLDSVLYG